MPWPPLFFRLGGDAAAAATAAATAATDAVAVLCSDGLRVIALTVHCGCTVVTLAWVLQLAVLAIVRAVRAPGLVLTDRKQR